MKVAPARGPKAFNVEKIRTLDGLHGLRTEWEHLLQRCRSRSVFVTFEWLSTWWKHLGGGGELSVITVRDRAGLVALLPAYIRGPDLRHPFRTVALMGSGDAGSDYLDLLVDQGPRAADAVRAVASEVARWNIPVELSRILPASPLIETLVPMLDRSGWAFTSPEKAVCPYLPLEGPSFENYLAGLGPKHRYNFRRRLRHLSREYQLEFRTVATQEERRESLRQLIRLHKHRWRSRGGTTAFHRPELEAFHEEFSRIAFEKGWLELLVLNLDGRPAALIYGFRYRSTFSFYQSAFDPAYASHSVGLVAMGLAIRRAAEAGLREYDMLHGDEGYKFLWTSRSRELTTASAFPPTWKGAASRSFVHLRSTASRMARNLLGQRVEAGHRTVAPQPAK